jgi:hypothetical protein
MKTQKNTGKHEGLAAVASSALLGHCPDCLTPLGKGLWRQGYDIGHLQTMEEAQALIASGAMPMRH